MPARPTHRQPTTEGEERRGGEDRKESRIVRRKKGRKGEEGGTGHRIAIKDGPSLFTHIFIDPICNVIRDGACSNMGYSQRE